MEELKQRLVEQKIRFRQDDPGTIIYLNSEDTNGKEFAMFFIRGEYRVVERKSEREAHGSIDDMLAFVELVRNI